MTGPWLQTGEGNAPSCFSAFLPVYFLPPAPEPQRSRGSNPLASGCSTSPLPCAAVWQFWRSPALAAPLAQGCEAAAIPATFLELSGERQGGGWAGLFAVGPVFRSAGLFLH